MKKRTGYLMLRTPDGKWLGEKEGKKKRGIWYAAWTVAGKKFMQTTRKRDFRHAETELRRIMEPFIAGDEVTTLQNIAARIEGRTAELTRLEDERNPPLTMARAWSAYTSAPGHPDSGESTLRQYEGHFDAFADWLKLTHPDAPALRDVTPEIAGKYANHLAERGLSGNRFNKHVRFLALLFRVLKEPAHLTGNPWEGIHHKRVITSSRRELTIDELKTVCAGATGEFRLLFALGIYTGLRLGDAATLRWAEVDWRRRIIRRVPNKIARRNPHPVIIPIHLTLATLLGEIPTAERGEYVLPQTAALYLANAPALSNRIQALFTGCGVRTVKRGTGFVTIKGPDGKEKPVSTGKRAVVEVGFHSLRHTFVSLCRESNAPLAVVEAIVGHSNPAMTRHYTHVSETAACAAVAALPSVMGNTSAPAALPAPKTVDAGTVRVALDRMNAKNWKTVKTELLALVS